LFFCFFATLLLCSSATSFTFLSFGNIIQHCTHSLYISGFLCEKILNSFQK
jgi:hypothetical protein